MSGSDTVEAVASQAAGRGSEPRRPLQDSESVGLADALAPSEVVRKLYKQYGCNQIALAKALRISQPNVSRILNGFIAPDGTATNQEPRRRALLKRIASLSGFKLHINRLHKPVFLPSENIRYASESTTPDGEVQEDSTNIVPVQNTPAGTEVRP